uniref:DUF1725 domain-containing protein n=1 Tax=Sus scrofa TaxID=9823 RepID=A0A8D1XQ04_PIG
MAIIKSLQTASAGEGVEKRELYYTIGGNVNWYNHYGETVWKYFGKLNTELPHDTAVPLLGTYPDKTFIENDTCTHMFTAALVTIAKTRKQPKCPSMDECIRKMWYVHTMEYYSAIKKDKIMPFTATWMETDSHTE